MAEVLASLSLGTGGSTSTRWSLAEQLFTGSGHDEPSQLFNGSSSQGLPFATTVAAGAGGRSVAQGFLSPRGAVGRVQQPIGSGASRSGARERALSRRTAFGLFKKKPEPVQLYRKEDNPLPSITSEECDKKLEEGYRIPACGCNGQLDANGERSLVWRKGGKAVVGEVSRAFWLGGFRYYLRVPTCGIRVPLYDRLILLPPSGNVVRAR